MAEEKAAAQEQPVEEKKKSSSKSSSGIYIVLLIINMAVVAGVGFMLYMNKKQQDEKGGGIEAVIEGEKEAAQKEANANKFIGQIIPLETFLVNLSGNLGRKLVKVNMELEVDGDQVQEEIEQLKPKIRDIIIVILSSKTYVQISTSDRKDSLRDEIKDQVNLFLTKGQIKRVYFTDILYN